MHSQPSNSGSGPRPEKTVAAAASLESAKPNSTPPTSVVGRSVPNPDGSTSGPAGSVPATVVVGAGAVAVTVAVAIVVVVAIVAAVAIVAVVAIVVIVVVVGSGVAA